MNNKIAAGCTCRSYAGMMELVDMRDLGDVTSVKDFMEKLNFDFFFHQLSLGKFIDETQFYFADDPDETDRFLGYLPQFDLPYWVGDCDIEDGCEFRTAEELVSAPIYDGRSLAERWDMVRLISIEGISLDDWVKCVSGV